MKAVIYQKRNKPERLQYRDVEKPIPKENEVLIKIHAVSLNAADYRSLKLGSIPKTRIFGADIAGVVESAGSNTAQFKQGDEVMGDLSDFGFGGMAEYAVAPEKALVKKPQKISFEEAAALPLAAGTALQAFRVAGNAQKGQQVLIVGSGGGVGTFAVQLASYFEAEITAVCSTRNLEQSRNLGAHQVIDYTKEDFTRRKGQHFDLILAINGSYPLLACKRLLKPNGTYVMVGGTMAQIFKAILFGWLLSAGSKKIRSLSAKSKPDDLQYLAGLAENGKIKPVIEKRYSLDKAAEAMQYLGAGHALGKVIINVD
jgi:NADPH:quinone reductase-like Zn-dependent oxidoreductase